MPLVPGSRIGHYEIKESLGSGGMGEVYRARDLTLDRDVALKFLPAHLTADADRLRRFEQEARAASALNHPAIVSIYELGRTDDQPYISMELVDGQTLRQVAARGALPPRRLLNLAAQIASALAKAHAAGIVHRDLKPDNLMLTSDDHAKVLDFGLAKLAPDLSSDLNQSTTMDRGTTPGALLGTVGYMSPEQARGEATDFRSDQFSFGLVLYELLSGRRPFQRSTTVETLSAIIRDDLPPLEVTHAGLAPLGWIVERCLAKAPEERYASTHDLAVDLARVRDRLSDRSAVSTAAPVLKPASMARRELLAWIAVGVLATGALAWFLLQGSSGAGSAPAGTVRLTLMPPGGGDFSFSIGVSPFAMSPDGHQIAFLGVGKDSRQRQAWLQAIDSLEPRPIAGTENATKLFWSPDGKTLGFFGDGKMKRVSIAGGDVTTICEAGGNGEGAAWSRDDVILFSPGENEPLWRVAASGGTPVQVTKLDTASNEIGHGWPTFLPDGRHYVFFLFGKEYGIYLSQLDSPERTRLATVFGGAAFVEPDWLFFVQERKLVAQRLDLAAKRLVGNQLLVAENVGVFGPTAGLSVSRSGSAVYMTDISRNFTQLTWLRRDGTPSGTLGPVGAYLNVRLSPDGRQVAVDQLDLVPSIWLMDVQRGAPARASFGGRYDSTPIWAPNSRSFVSASAREGPPNLYLTNVDNTQAEPKRLTTGPIQSFPQAWTRDGVIAYVQIEPGTGNDIWVVPASGNEKPRPLIRTKSNESQPRISPNGRWLAYTSNDSGNNEVYVTRFPEATGKIPVSFQGGHYPMWHPTGNELYYRRPDGMMMAVPIHEGPEFVAGSPQPLFIPQVRLSGIGVGTFYDVAADGRFLVNVFVERRTSTANVLLNWTPK